MRASLLSRTSAIAAQRNAVHLQQVRTVSEWSVREAHHPKRVKIVATIGPASEQADPLQQCVTAGEADFCYVIVGAGPPCTRLESELLS